jgi:hypothetical protein
MSNDDEGAHASGSSHNPSHDIIQHHIATRCDDDSVSNCSYDERNIDAASIDGNGSTANDLSKRDTKRLLQLKLIVILIFILSATIISVVVYLYISRNEAKQFEAKFRNDADKVLSAVSTSIQRSLGALNAIAVTFVSYASDQGLEWPFVTLPDFALHASKLLPLTDGLYVLVVPTVTPAQKGKWEAYAASNDYWVNQSIAIQEVWDGYNGKITYDWARSEKVHGVFGEIESNLR